MHHPLEEVGDGWQKEKGIRRVRDKRGKNGKGTGKTEGEKEGNKWNRKWKHERGKVGKLIIARNYTKENEKLRIKVQIISERKL